MASCDIWQDCANSQWVNLFSGYTPTWYSNEDCTTTVLSSAMDISHTYYVKLTWNNPTLTIEPQSGETTLTSAIVTRELAKASSNPSVVTKVVIDSNFKTGVSSVGIAKSNFPNLTAIEWKTYNLLISGYDLLEYAKSNGNSVIQTNLTMNPSTITMELDLQFTKIDVTQLNGALDATIGAGCSIGVKNGYFGTQCSQLGSSVVSQSKVADLNRHYFKVDKPNGKFYIDDNMYTNFSNSNHTSNNHLKLFACGSQFNNTNEYAYQKLYQASISKVIDGVETLQGLYLPAKRQNDSAIGLYDIVNDTFYTDANLTDN